MILEIEKMKSLQEKADATQKQEIDNIINTISTDFEEMIHNTRIFLMTGERITRDLSNSITELQKLRNIGNQYGIEFPEINDTKGAAVYILQFGRQIIKGE